MNDSKSEAALHDGAPESSIHYKAKKAVLYATRGWVSHRALGPEDFYVVSFSRTRQYWKTILSTHQSHSKYYEVTYNGILDAVVVDVYQKHSAHNFMGEALDNFHI